MDEVQVRPGAGGAALPASCRADSGETLYRNPDTVGGLPLWIQRGSRSKPSWPDAGEPGEIEFDSGHNPEFSRRLS